MAILYVSNQPEDYSGSMVLDTNVAHFDVAKVPHAMTLIDNRSFLQIEDFVASATTVTWFHFQSFIEHDTFDDGRMLDFKDASGNLLSDIEILDGKYAARTNGDTTVTSAFTPSVVANSVSVDVKIEVDASNITTTLYVDKALIGSATAANTIGGKGKPTRMDLVFADALQNTNAFISEIIVAETDTRDLRLYARPPVAAGFHTDYDGAVADLDDHDDETVMTAALNGDRMSNTIASITGVNIHCVAITSRSATDGTGPANLKQGFRIGGVDYDSATAVTQGATLLPTRHFFETSPATGIDWTTAEISGAEIMQLAQT